jgi:hypothetical protein
MPARDAGLSLGHGALPIMLAPIALVGPTAFSGGVGRNCIGEPTQPPAPEISVRQPEQRAGLEPIQSCERSGVVTRRPNKARRQGNIPPISTSGEKLSTTRTRTSRQQERGHVD